MNQFDPYSGRRPTALLGASLAALLSLPLHAANVDGQRIANADAEPGNWMSHGRDYGEQRYSPLKKITDENVENDWLSSGHFEQSNLEPAILVPVAP